MQVEDAAAAPPIALIRWWFGKTEEERRGFLQSPTTSAKARQNIPLVEAYARRHCYFVACETNLDVCPLPSLSPVLQTTSRRRGYGVWLPCAAHGEGTYGGRYAAAAQREKRRAAAHRVFEEISARTAVALGDYVPRLGPAAPEEEGRHGRAARMMVAALLEASVAALYRLGLTDALEAIEQATAQDGASSAGEHETGGGGVVPKPVGVRRAEAHSCLGVWMLLLAAPGGKRLRGAEDTAALQQPQPAPQQRQWPHDAKVNCWQLLRERMAPASAEEPERAGTAAKEDEAAAMVPHSEPRITITLADMRFGIAKALKNRGGRTT
ncbi:uncharacterized protein Tco025E_03800 [Trypanosoma conorhini]|uniref:Uncharacterized protein n=1 Tax=Trypanosoma conorhini TaxID=83891 RepID=A0A3R7NM01_9TRYP|nr:uncharacterized protein Tco025E_03800 [Trypanosoma conorhini]RNF20344.1 hypothetical protein Tco025E_03800 [Trypanosoma conorhini]